MARTQRELEGWEIVIKDENGNIIDSNDDNVRSRRSHRRGGVEHVFLRKIDDKDVMIGRGSSIITRVKGKGKSKVKSKGKEEVKKEGEDEDEGEEEGAENSGPFMISFVNDIRLNTPGSLVEIWAFQYLQRSNVSPRFYLKQFKPESVTQETSNEDIQRLFYEEVDENELFFTTQACEPRLDEFVSLAHIMDEAQWQQRMNSGGSKLARNKEFLVKYITFNYGERCVPLNLTQEIEVVKSMKPKEAEEHFKDILWPNISDEFKLGVKPRRANRKRNRKELLQEEGEEEEEEEEDTEKSAKKLEKDESEGDDSIGYDSVSSVYESGSEYSGGEQDQEQDDDDDNIEEEDEDEDIEDTGTDNGDDDDNSIDDIDEDGHFMEKKKSKKTKRSNKVKQSTEAAPATNKKRALKNLHRKFTKKNVVRSKKKYTSFSKRFKYVEDIPDLTKIDLFYRDTSELINTLESRLTTNSKIQVVETIFSKAKKRLYSSSSSSSSLSSSTLGKEDIVKTRDFSEYLPGRDNEFASIYLSVYSAIESESSTTVYIAGTPGVGKTLTVREVVQELQLSTIKDELPKFQYIEINGLKIVKPTDCYQLLWQKISSEELTWGASMESLDFYFNKVPKDKKLPIVVLIDELDALVTKAQDIMYNFFNWTTYANAKLVVIAIANTMDLPERHLGNKVSSRIGFTRIMFTGYTFEELKTIINLRLKGFNDTFFYVDSRTGRAYQAADGVFGGSISNEKIKIGKVGTTGLDLESNPNIVRVKLRMTPDAIEIASRKIASVSGDARRALKVCRRATEIAEENYMLQHGFDYGGSSSTSNANFSYPEESAKLLSEPVEPVVVSPSKKERDEHGEYEVQIVDIKHIMKALNETLTSNYVTFISRQSFTTRLFLCAFLHLIEKTNSQEQTLGDIIDEIKTLIEVNGNNKFVLKITQTLFGGSRDDNNNNIDDNTNNDDDNGKNKKNNNNRNSGQSPEQLRMRSWDYLIGSLIDAGILIRQNMKNERACSVRINISLEEVKKAIEQDTVLKTF